MGNEATKEEQPDPGQDKPTVTHTQVNDTVHEDDEELETQSQRIDKQESKRRREEEDKRQKDLVARQRQQSLEEMQLQKDLEDRKRQKELEEQQRQQQEKEERERKRQMEKEEIERKRQMEEEKKLDAEKRRKDDASNREKLRERELAREAEDERLKEEQKKESDAKAAAHKKDEGVLDDLLAMAADGEDTPKGYEPPTMTVSEGWKMADKKWDNSKFRRVNKFDAAPAVSAPAPETTYAAANPASSPAFSPSHHLDDDDESMMNDILNDM